MISRVFKEMIRSMPITSSKSFMVYPIFSPLIDISLISKTQPETNVRSLEVNLTLSTKTQCLLSVRITTIITIPNESTILCSTPTSTLALFTKLISIKFPLSI